MNPGRDSFGLKLDVSDSYELMSRRAEQLIVEQLKQRPNLLLCASAGGTPTRLYELLSARGQSEPRLFKKMRVLQIDEWGGLPKGHPASCESDLQIKLLKPLGIERDRYIGFRTAARRPERECARVAQWLKANGPIDICILGLGLNGHVAMNEPADNLTTHAHVARLARSSLNHPMLKHVSRKPSYGLTVGISDILCSRTVLLLVNGQHKRAAMKQLLNPVVTTKFPASLLWLHSRAIVLCDREAAPSSPKR